MPQCRWMMWAWSMHQPILAWCPYVRGSSRHLSSVIAASGASANWPWERRCRLRRDPSAGTAATCAPAHRGCPTSNKHRWLMRRPCQRRAAPDHRAPHESRSSQISKESTSCTRTSWYCRDWFCPYLGTLWLRWCPRNCCENCITLNFTLNWMCQCVIYTFVRPNSKLQFHRQWSCCRTISVCPEIYPPTTAPLPMPT